MQDIINAIKILKKGGMVIFPTDTALGIGCRMDNEKAIERLFKIRKRPPTQATPVLVSSIKMAQDYLLFPLSNNVRPLMEKYWPGALTIVYPCKEDKVPLLVRGGGQNLGVRMPNHKITQQLIDGVGVPILGPSANFHGKTTPYKYNQLDRKLLKLVDYVVKGECQVGNVSTVIDCSVTPWKILRQGAVTLDKIDKVILYIDTKEQNKTEVGLKINGKKNIISKRTFIWTSQVLLPLIEEILRKNKLTVFDISKIHVESGPGSFTGLRVGIAVANTLGWLLDVPVNGKKERLVEPIYTHLTLVCSSKS